MIAENLHIFFRGPIGSVGHLCHVVKERALSLAQLGFIQLAVRNCLYRLLVCSLNPQEVGM